MINNKFVTENNNLIPWFWHPQTTRNFTLCYFYNLPLKVKQKNKNIFIFFNEIGFIFLAIFFLHMATVAHSSHSRLKFKSRFHLTEWCYLSCSNVGASLQTNHSISLTSYLLLTEVSLILVRNFWTNLGSSEVSVKLSLSSKSKQTQNNLRNISSLGRVQFFKSMIKDYSMTGNDHI